MKTHDFYQPHLVTSIICLFINAASIAMLMMLNIDHQYIHQTFAVLLLINFFVFTIQIAYNGNNPIAAGLFNVAYFIAILSFYITKKMNIAFFSNVISAQAILLTFDLIACFVTDFFSKEGGTYRFLPADWQLGIVRIYVGISLIPYFSDKLLIVLEPNSTLFTFAFLEMIVSLTLVLGFFTRLGCIVFVIYMASIYITGVDSTSLFWFDSISAWEYPIFFLIIIITYFINGASVLSIDHIISRLYTLPNIYYFFTSPRDY